MYIINAAWWLSQGFYVYGEIKDLKKDIESLVHEQAPIKKYVVTLTKVVTTACDCLSLKKDMEACSLKGVDLQKNQISSAKLQAMGCASRMAGNIINTGQTIDPDVVLRILAICRRTGQGTASPILEQIPNTIIGLGISTIIINETFPEYFNQWYAMHEATAAGIEYELDYEGIPEEHHDNLIFSQFIDPISLDPIRFPVTAPNKLGGPDHHFERASILKWLTNHTTNPVSNLPLKITELKENTDMRAIIEAEMLYLGLNL